MEEWLGPLMFAAALVLIFTGFPVAFSLAGTAIIFAFIGVEMEIFDLAFLLAMPDRTFGIMSNMVLLAVPFFIFMGTMLAKSRLAEDLLTTVGQLFGPVRGGLGIAVVFVGALLAAATGVVGASVVAMASAGRRAFQPPVAELTCGSRAVQSPAVCLPVELPRASTSTTIRISWSSKCSRSSRRNLPIG